ncbi:hypothetical protein FRC10_007555 [Ceratobasidium sp. 414]|nr:hypothetical protein FRC10_007555 [Ceratobasidium sp. 414]
MSHTTRTANARVIQGRTAEDIYAEAEEKYEQRLHRMEERYQRTKERLQKQDDRIEVLEALLDQQEIMINKMLEDIASLKQEDNNEGDDELSYTNEDTMNPEEGYYRSDQEDDMEDLLRQRNDNLDYLYQQGMLTAEELWFLVHEEGTMTNLRNNERTDPDELYDCLNATGLLSQADFLRLTSQPYEEDLGNLALSRP